MEDKCPVWDWYPLPDRRKGRSERRTCGKPAKLFQVGGKSFHALQVLCNEHAERARAEGFVLTPVEASVETV